MKRKNLAFELLKKLLNEEINARVRQNVVQSKKLMEIMEEAIRRYKNKLITAAEVIEELIKLAKQIKQEDLRVEEMGLSMEELAFYDALANNESARNVMGDEKLRDLAIVLVDRIRKNASIDWNLKENVRAKLKVMVKRLLRKYGYPPDKQAIATETVLQQAKLFTEKWLNTENEG
jgi:type I restriction enzyme, R subunit